LAKGIKTSISNSIGISIDKAFMFVLNVDVIESFNLVESRYYRVYLFFGLVPHCLLRNGNLRNKVNLQNSTFHLSINNRNITKFITRH